MIRLSVVIITKNEAYNMRRCLDSVRNIANEVIVVDSGSQDGTIAICKEYGCTVIHRDFDGYSNQKQFAVDQASNDWVLSVDADEEITPELGSEIQTLLDQDIIPEAGFFIPRLFHYMGRVMKHGGAGSQFYMRLYNRHHGRFTKVPVHEVIEVDGPTGYLSGTMIHYSYRDIAHHIEKINTYSTLAAEGYIRKGRRFSTWWVALKFPVTFITCYFIKGGFRDGYPGFMWAWLAAVTASLKIAKTLEHKGTSK
jgi:glycosyltransferase involved in cell wall biosynthesis